MKKRVYIAGPMRKHPVDLNFPAFDAAAARFREWGYDVVNPAEHDRKRGLTVADWARDDGTLLKEIAVFDANELAHCTHIALLPGWEDKSDGAMAEFHFAKWIKLKILDAINGEALDVKTIVTVARSCPQSRPVPAIVHHQQNPPNPKDRIGKMKPPLHLVPSASLIFEALAMGDGAKKYDPFNWRVTPVEAMTYVGACKRHLEAWVDGEEVATDSLVHHLGHAKACLGIILDAQATGKLIDNRPAHGQAAALLARFTTTEKK